MLFIVIGYLLLSHFLLSPSSEMLIARVIIQRPRKNGRALLLFHEAGSFSLCYFFLGFRFSIKTPWLNDRPARLICTCVPEANWGLFCRCWSMEAGSSIIR